MSATKVDETLPVIDGEIETRAAIASTPGKAVRNTPDAAVGFDERSYLVAFPDIAAAIAAGEPASAFNRHRTGGPGEDRPSDLGHHNAAIAKNTATFPAGYIDTVFCTRDGWVLVIGWFNEERGDLGEIALLKASKVLAVVHHLARCRREDAEAAVTARQGKLLGFWTVLRVDDGLAPCSQVRLMLAAGRERKTFSVRPKHVSDERLRELVLEYLASARYFANPQAESALQLRHGLGQTLVDLNVTISTRVMAGAYVTRLGRHASCLEGSIVVCLYGKAEYLFLQASAFSGCPGADRYEFIYVSNSPELAETLLKEASMACRIYDIRITLVILPGNAGFGAANNVAAAHARSNRILIVNPDVFPRDRDWATRHSAAVAELPPEQTALFGVPLYYDDGSLMHAGMFFDIDAGVSIRDGRIERHDLIRVEHYAKGAPPDTPAFLASRKVPAVTGAFVSLDRTWFEALGGFSLEYVLGHYEDADLCLKSLVRGRPVWVHNVPFWHLEGKGSTRRHVHEGASTVNRWHFTRLWKDVIVDRLCGRAPARLAAP
jgi:GT2 family glycosyltransferase